MSATVSMYFRQLLLANTFQPGANFGLDAIFVALTNKVGQANATGAQLDEPAGGGYQRAEYAVGADYWALSGFSEVLNKSAIQFPTATGDWGLITGWALVDDIESGLTLAVGSLVEPTQIDEGMTPVIDVGVLTVGLYD